MCFSAAASFSAAGATGAIGLLCLTRVRGAREIALAAIPIFFAAQQTIEGFLWLAIPAAPDGPAVRRLTFLFLLFAQVLWPVFAPAAVWLVEPPGRRRRAMGLWLGLASVLSACLLFGLVTHPHSAGLLNDHIVYLSTQRIPPLVSLIYFAVLVPPVVISSSRTISLFGLILTVGYAVTYVFYRNTYQSVWCYFAAAASLVLAAYFLRRRRREPSMG